MARLILTEGGSTRRFKLSTGKTTFGSGSSAGLRIESDEVAEIHGELEMTDEGLVVRTAKGVLPPSLGGKPVRGEHILRDGEQLSLGGAKLSVEYDEGEGPAKPVTIARTTRAAAAGAGGASRRRSGGASARSRRGADDADDDEGRPRRRTTRRSDPTGMLIGAAVGLVLLGAGYWVITKTTRGLAGKEFNYETSFKRAVRTAEEGGAIASAERQLEAILREPLSAEQRKQVEAELAKLQANDGTIDLTAHNAEGSKWLESRVMAYSRDFPVTEDRGYARAFMQRANWWRERWPEHPERSAVERLLDRVRKVADPTSPMTTEDLGIVVGAWVDISPPYFHEGYLVVDGFLAKATDEAARNRAGQIRREINQKEKDYAAKKLQEASAMYQTEGDLARLYNPGQAIHDLVGILVRCEDAEIRADAARRLMGITEMDVRHMRAEYKRGRPDHWARMITEPTFRAWADENGML